jgi:hypothetical protein
MQETTQQPLFIKLNTGGEVEFINFMYVVSVRLDHDTSDNKACSMILHLTNGQYRTVKGESARRLKRTLEYLNAAASFDPEETLCS